MALNTASANSLLRLLLQGTAIANTADNAAAAPATTASVSLHTADPGAAGSQATSEAAYAGYARVSVARSALGWTVTDNAAVNAAEIAFPLCTDGASVTYTHVGVQVGGVFMRGALSPSVAVFAGITPKLAIGQLTLTGITSL